jgi:ribosomal-protein-alanine N-acetyltransferase
MLIKMHSSVREATTSDLQKLANLIHFEAHIHRHLDYRPPLDWVGERPFLVLERNRSIIAALACPPDPPQVAWIRLFAASSQTLIWQAWEALHQEAMIYLKAMPELRWLAAIPMHRWFEDLLVGSSFEYTHSITMLSWENHPLPEITVNRELNIRPMSIDDLPAVQRVDAASFSPIWQNSLPYLELAFRQAAIATVAEREGQIIGYQISTSTPMGGHLARLAVDPQCQGQGVGQHLLHDLLTQFIRRGAHTVTVNTQKDNNASIALYRRMGFEFTGEEYPVYQKGIGAAKYEAKSATANLPEKMSQT